MQRGEYLRLRAEQFEVSFGVQSWDTRPLGELAAIQANLADRVEREQALARAAIGRIATERQVGVDHHRRLVTYLRAVCYLREHGIAPDWPRGSVPATPFSVA